MNFKAGDRIHGFKVNYTQYIDEIKATLVRMEFEKNGADLVWLDRDDNNKTFVIGFKTVPTDSTGVPHILEHSVLCGSDKYPVKEPFVDLLKSSLATFLNAFTFPDKTCYPLSSRNDKDFMNLMDVYLDAVFHPLSIKDPHAFRQEGWHFEPDDQNGWVFNGVVYNEMKGATSGADGVLQDDVQALLFPENTYGVNSGGAPKNIPDLTYEQYCEFHRKFYSPTNSRIFLDGRIDIDAVLTKIEEFIGAYDRIDVDSDIPMQKPVAPAEKTDYYEVSQGEETEGKTIACRGYVTGKFDEYEEALALQMITEVLAGSNEAPLCKAVLEKNLAENVEFGVTTGVQQVFATITARNIKTENKDEVWNVIDGVLSEQVSKGLNREQLHSVLNRMEFQAKEKDFNRMPKGLVYALNSFDSWLYGGDPADTLVVNDKYASLNKKIDEGWFEKILDERIIKNGHRAQVVLLPSKTIGEEIRKDELARARKRTENWTEEEKAAAMREFEELRRKQSEPDTPEAAATLPKLSLSDVSETIELTKQNISEISGVKVMNQPLATDGITYLNLYFNMAGLTAEEISASSFLAVLMGSLPTKIHDVNGLNIELDGKLGRFNTDVTVFGKDGDMTKANPNFSVRISLLEERKSDAVKILDEVLNTTKFDDAQYIRMILKQTLTGMQQSIMMNGTSYASSTAASSLTEKRNAESLTRGMGYYGWIKAADSAYDEKGAEICSKLSGLAEKIFTKGRLTVGLTGNMDEAFVKDVISVIREGNGGIAAELETKPLADGYMIPTEIGFAGKAVKAGGYSGTSILASQILFLEYLWGEVRVKGGAYGTGMNAQSDGVIVMNSYRDPSPANTLKTFGGAGEALRTFCNAGKPYENYIISTISRVDPLTTPRSQGADAESVTLCGKTQEDRQTVYSQILKTTREQLVEYSRIIDKINDKDAKSCIISGKTGIDAGVAEKLIEKVEQV